MSYEYFPSQALNWIHDTGEFYLSTHTKLGEDKEETEGLLTEYNEFKSAAKVSKILWSSAAHPLLEEITIGVRKCKTL